MAELRTIFGQSVKAHRRRLNLTQEALAERAGLSLDMVAKIEGGSSGASFATIELLAKAMSIEPSALFGVNPQDQRFSKSLHEIVRELATLSEDDLHWVKALLDVALRPRRR
ncbi:helix-turn-helix domain-containing protein [Pseudorhizobium marinum]|uniref:helix-turn-helix domain-containing protein n=1 Tax=Pseudorhizobium marinum TaxID=1496690 RepID=UPI000497E030